MGKLPGFAEGNGINSVLLKLERSGVEMRLDGIAGGVDGICATRGIGAGLKAGFWAAGEGLKLTIFVEEVWGVTLRGDSTVVSATVGA